MDERAARTSRPRPTTLDALGLDAVLRVGLASRPDAEPPTVAGEERGASRLDLVGRADADPFLPRTRRTRARPPTPTAAGEVGWWGVHVDRALARGRRRGGAVAASDAQVLAPARPRRRARSPRGPGVGSALDGASPSARAALRGRRGSRWAMYAQNDAARRIYRRLGSEHRRGAVVVPRRSSASDLPACVTARRGGVTSSASVTRV